MDKSPFLKQPAMTRLSTTRAKTRDKAKALRRQSTGGRDALYEACKNAWDAANPGADWRTREQAMRRLADAAGV